jgi:hypothetical protein
MPQPWSIVPRVARPSEWDERGIGVADPADSEGHSLAGNFRGLWLVAANGDFGFCVARKPVWFTWGLAAIA